MIPSRSLIITAGCLAVFSAVNLHNILRYHDRPTKGASEPEVPVPQGFTVGLVALGTGAFFLESLLYLLLGVLNRELSQLPILDLPFTESDPFEFAGALIMTLGYAIFIWSVIARGDTQRLGRCLRSSNLSIGGRTGTSDILPTWATS